MADYFPKTQVDARLEVAVLVSQNTNRDQTFTYPRLGQKTFVVDAIKNKSVFPKEWRNPEDFAAIGLPKTTPWFLDWRSEDLDSDWKDMFTLWLNLKYQTQFNQLGLNTKFGLSQNQMSASIIADVMANIFKRAHEQGSLEFGVSGDLVKKLKGALGVGVDEIRAVIDTPKYYSIISSWSLEMMEVGKTLESINE